MSHLDPSDKAIESLLPHQAELAENFFSPGSSRVLLLKAEPGFGKTTALCALIARLLRDQSKARVLLIVPAMLKEQFAMSFRTTGTPSRQLDRFLFRKMIDASTSGVVWPEGAVVIVSREFARLPDVRESLANVRWDLVVADEAHGLTGPESTEALRLVTRTASRVILATLPGLAVPSVSPPDQVKVLEWKREQLVDQDGKPLVGVPRPSIYEVAFGMSSAETMILNSVCELDRLLSDGRESRFATATLTRASASSPAALEKALRRLYDRTSAWDSSAESVESAGADATEDERSLADIPKLTAEATDTVRKALLAIEMVTQDSKLSAFMSLLSHFRQGGPADKRVCVLTYYVSTMYYLAAEMEAAGVECQLVHGGMSGDERQAVLRTPHAGIYVATRASTEGFGLNDITDLVLYDVPRSPARMTELLARCDRVGRRSQLEVYLLRLALDAGHRLFELIPA